MNSQTNNTSVRLIRKIGKQTILIIILIIIAIFSVAFTLSIIRKVNNVYNDEVRNEIQILNESILRLSKSNMFIYEEIERLRASGQTTNSRFRQKIYDVKQMADELNYFLQEISLDCIRNCEGIDSKSIEGMDYNIYSIKNLRNISSPEKVLFGADSLGKANLMIDVIDSYLQYLLEIVNGNQVVEMDLKHSIDAERLKVILNNEEDNYITWAEYYFKGITLGRTLVRIKQFQYSTRLSENIIITFLHDRIKI